MSSKVKPKADTLQNALETARKALEDEQANAASFQENIDPDDYIDFEPVTPPSRDEQVLLNVLDELREVDGAQVRVYRATKGQPMEYLFSPHFCDDLLGSIMEQLQIDYGRGTYRIQARVPGGALKLNREISIGDMPKSKREEIEREQRRGQTVPDKSGDSMREMFAMQMQMANQSKAEMLQMFTMMQQGTQAMIQALAARPEPQRPEGLTIQDVIALLPVLQGNHADPMDTLVKGIELGKDLNGGGETNFADVAKSALGSLGSIVSQIPKTPPAPPQMPVMQPRPNPLPQPVAPAPVIPPVPAEPSAQQYPPELLSLVTILEKGGSRDGDPYSYAGILLDTLGDDEGGAVCETPENIAFIVQAFPQLLPYTAWLEKVRQCALHLLGGAEPVNIGDNDSGDITDATTDTAGTVTGNAPDQD